MIEAAAQRDEFKAVLAIQMARTYSEAMGVLSNLGTGGGSDRRVVALGSAAARLLKAYAMQAVPSAASWGRADMIDPHVLDAS
jgi:hypothetical protein